MTLWIGLTAGIFLIAAYNLAALRKDRERALELRRQRRQAPPDIKEGPLVSVLVAAWNEVETIEDHIRSFLTLRYPKKELILCAGGEDGTLGLAERMAGEGEIQLFPQEAGEGKQSALRRAYERASGEVVYLTDADCCIDDGAFERLLAEVVAGEAAATGTCDPPTRQREHPYVLLRWYTDLFSQRPHERYITGLLGRNSMLQRSVLDVVGAFEPEVQTGTDYELAKRLLASGHRIRNVVDSAVQSPLPDGPGEFWLPQSRYLRNVVVHGLRYRAYREVLGALVPSLIGAVMVGLPVMGMFLHPAFAGLWGLLWAHVLLSRLRYIRFGRAVTGQEFPALGYLRLPFDTLAEFLIWLGTMLQYPIRSWRRQW